MLKNGAKTIDKITYLSEKIESAFSEDPDKSKIHYLTKINRVVKLKKEYLKFYEAKEMLEKKNVINYQINSGKHLQNVKTAFENLDLEGAIEKAAKSIDPTNDNKMFSHQR